MAYYAKYNSLLNCNLFLSLDRDSLEPLFTARSLSFETHSVFLDASHTPLRLAFDTFPLGGNVLHVRGEYYIYKVRQ